MMINDGTNNGAGVMKDLAKSLQYFSDAQSIEKFPRFWNSLIPERRSEILEVNQGHEGNLGSILLIKAAALMKPNKEKYAARSSETVLQTVSSIPMNAVLTKMSAEERMELIFKKTPYVAEVILERYLGNLIHGETANHLLMDLDIKTSLKSDGRPSYHAFKSIKGKRIGSVKPTEWDEISQLVTAEDSQLFVNKWEKLSPRVQRKLLNYGNDLPVTIISQAVLMTWKDERPFIAIMQSLDAEERISYLRPRDVKGILFDKMNAAKTENAPGQYKIKSGEALFKGMTVNQRVRVLRSDPYMGDFFAKEEEQVRKEGARFNDLHPMLQTAFVEIYGKLEAKTLHEVIRGLKIANMHHFEERPVRKLTSSLLTLNEEGTGIVFMSRYTLSI
jgi:hypothetical protein